MNILCIETSAVLGSVALQRGEVQFEATIQTPRAQTEQLIPQIGAVLSEAGIGLQDLGAIGFGCGPGSFVGVRLAAAVAQGLATALGIGLAPVSSMAALAGQLAVEQTMPPDGIIVCLDARMGEVYRGEYDCSSAVATAVAPEQLLLPAQMHWPGAGTWIAAGSGFAEYPQLSRAARDRGFDVQPDVQPHARGVIPLARAAFEAGRLVAPADWRARYLRDKTAWQALE